MRSRDGATTLEESEIASAAASAAAGQSFIATPEWQAR